MFFKRIKKKIIMKRFNTILIALLLFSSVVLMPSRVSAFVPYGDVNWSTDVNIDDVVRLIDDILTGKTSIADDVDGNLEVNIIDVTTLIDYLLGGELVFDLYNPPVPDSALVITVNGVSFAMMPVKGGSFTPHYSPYVPSSLNDYYMGMTEVTFELWDAVMESRPILRYPTGVKAISSSSATSMPAIARRSVFSLFVVLSFLEIFLLSFLLFTTAFNI